MIEAIWLGASGNARIDTESESATATTEGAGIKNNANEKQTGNGAIAATDAGARAPDKQLIN